MLNSLFRILATVSGIIVLFLVAYIFIFNTTDNVFVIFAGILMTIFMIFIFLIFFLLKTTSAGLYESSKLGSSSEINFNKSKDFLVAFIIATSLLVISFLFTEITRNFLIILSIYTYGVSIIRYAGYRSHIGAGKWNLATNKAQSGYLTLFTLLYILVSFIYINYIY